MVVTKREKLRKQKSQFIKEVIPSKMIFIDAENKILEFTSLTDLRQVVEILEETKQRKFMLAEE